MESGCAIFYDPVFLQHDTGNHPENHTRLLAIVSALKSAPFADKLSWQIPSSATIDQIETIHDPAYVKLLEERIKAGAGALDADTITSKFSWDAARKAAGAVIDGVAGVLDKKFSAAFCAVRPPGHHAESDRAMGFCLFNNVAIGARYAQRERGVEKVAIIDFDVHHGNGTQNSFYDDPSVLYISMHQWPHYPGSGAAEERGVGRGEGATINIPLHAGSGDDDYQRAFNAIAAPALKKFDPGLILISAGFDAHEQDPLAGMAVTEAGFAGMTSKIVEISKDLGCPGVVSTLEGGYHQAALGNSVVAHIKELIYYPS